MKKLKISCGIIFFVVSSAMSLKEFHFADQALPFQSDFPGQKLSFDEEYKLFQEELEKGIAKQNSAKSRQKRYVYLNTESNVDVGFLIVIPITVVLPPMSNLFNIWRRKRSISQTSSSYLNVTSETSPYIQSQIDRISSYFDLVHIPETTCQLRAICEMAAEPVTYFPLSDIILKPIREANGLWMNYPELGGNSTSTTTPTLFKLYNKAADDGATYGTSMCEENYKKSCKYSADKLLNMPIMKFWNKVQSNLRLKFEDDPEFTKI